MDSGLPCARDAQRRYVLLRPYIPRPSKICLIDSICRIENHSCFNLFCRRSSSVRSNSNNEAATSSHSAPGSPKIETLQGKSRSTIAASGGGSVLSHSYFHTLPEEAAVLFELKSHHESAGSQHGNQKPKGLGPRQSSNEGEANEYER